MKQPQLLSELNFARGGPKLGYKRSLDPREPTLRLVELKT